MPQAVEIINGEISMDLSITLTGKKTGWGGYPVSMVVPPPPPAPHEG